MNPCLPVIMASMFLATAGASHTNAKYKFSASAPKDWKQLSYPGTLVVFAGAPTGGFSPNLNVTFEKLPPGITLKQYEEVGRANLAKAITKYRFVGRRDITRSGLKAVEQSFTGRQGQFDLFFTRTVAIRSGRAYVLTGTGRADLRAGHLPPMAAFVKAFTFTR
jgi:hypothetical protein